MPRFWRSDLTEPIRSRTTPGLILGTNTADEYIRVTSFNGGGFGFTVGFDLRLR